MGSPTTATCSVCKTSVSRSGPSVANHNTSNLQKPFVTVMTVKLDDQRSSMAFIRFMSFVFQRVFT